MNVILSHPTGNRNVREVMAALLRTDQLVEFHTTITADPKSPWLKILPGTFQKEWLRRHYDVPKEKLKSHPFTESDFRNDLSQYGDSLLVISDDEVVKVHIHTERPGDVLNYGQQYGELVNLKIENMRQQHTTILEQDKKATTKPKAVQEAPSQYGIVTVAMGEGISELFRSIGANSVIEGGQTMNPSTEDILKAVDEVNAKTVFVLPNNKNIILAAEQARDVSDKNVVVIPSKTVPQGLSALLAFNPTLEADQIGKLMKDAMTSVVSGQVTYAVRDTKIDGLEIKKDDYMGIKESDIVVVNSDCVSAAKDLLKEMLDEDSEILTIIKGEDATEEMTEALTTFVEENYPDVEVEVHEGKQPLYPFIFSVE